MDAWRVFLWPADEWIVAYSVLGLQLFNSVQLFAVGHAAELYLKAAHAKQFGDVQGAIKLGHNIRRLWRECKSADPSFMVGYDLREEFCSIHLEQHALEMIPREARDEYGRNGPLYTVATLLPDLKYIGTPMKAFAGKQQALAWLYPDEYWIGFFKTLRRWLGHPSADRIDVIAEHLRGDELPERARSFLSGLYRD